MNARLLLPTLSLLATLATPALAAPTVAGFERFGRGEGVEHVRLRRLEQLGEGDVRADVRPHDQRVHEEADQGLEGRCAVLFSPSQGQLEARELAEWILEDRLQVRFQVQLHKYLWGDAPGH